MIQTVECTITIDVDPAFESWLRFYDDAAKKYMPNTQNLQKKIKFTPGYLPPCFDSKLRRIKIRKHAWTKAMKVNRAHNWNKIRQK